MFRPQSPRILLHSHASYGLGHLRRTTTLAEALVRRLPNALVLITTGSPCASRFTRSRGIDLVQLPSITKDASGAYVPRTLGSDLERVVELRRRILRETQRAFAPDVLVVDHQILGLADELDATLDDARAAGVATILGLRDVIDAPEAVAREWGRPRVRRALAESYDRVCVYGSPEVFDPRVAYPIPVELRARVEFVGYVARPTVPARPARARARPHVLVTTGGGEDGTERIETYLEALSSGPVRWDSTVVLGPLADPVRAGALQARARKTPGVRAVRFHPDVPGLLARSDAVVSMAGYNSVVEILQSRVPSVLLPRCFPRQEQLLRAERLAELGLARSLPSPTAIELHAAVESALESERVRGTLPSLEGAESLCSVVEDLVLEKRGASLPRRSTP